MSTFEGFFGYLPPSSVTATVSPLCELDPRRSNKKMDFFLDRKERSRLMRLQWESKSIIEDDLIEEKEKELCLCSKVLWS